MSALDDPGRLDAIARADLFEGLPEPSFEPYARIVAQLLEVPVALVSIVTDDRQFFPAQVGVGEPWATEGGTPIDLSFCQHVVTAEAPLVVADARQDARVADNGAIDELGVVAYLGVPLRAPGGEPLGSLCAIDHRPREWTDRELVVLHEVAVAVAQAIALRTSEHLWAEFASDVSHRLRTPIAAMQFELDDLAAWPSLDDAAREVVRSAGKRARELAEVVDGVTEAAQARRRLGATAVDLVAVVRDVADVEAVEAVDDPAEVVVTTSEPALRHVLARVAELLGAPGEGAVRARIEAAGGWSRVHLSLAVPPVAAPEVPADLGHLVRSQLGGRLSAVAATGGYELALPTS